MGGGARSALWRQLKADICQIPWRVPQVTEAVAQTIRFTQRIELQPDLAKLYDEQYALYRRVYPSYSHSIGNCSCAKLNIPKSNRQQNRESQNFEFSLST